MHKTNNVAIAIGITVLIIASATLGYIAGNRVISKQHRELIVKSNGYMQKYTACSRATVLYERHIYYCRSKLVKAEHKLAACLKDLK